ncbi:hypothetical protein [Thalassolituus sp.]|uniref:hypothetical protein n=1 Tax=Thalassolituus sp. TaxID=2030822 RepID=UPI003516E4CD
MLFLPIQQELDCITDDGRILGKIRYDNAQRHHIFYSPESEPELSVSERAMIDERLSGLDSGLYSIPMQDDD